MGLKKTRELISVFPALFSACIDRLDVVPANPSQYQYHLPGGIAFFFFLTNKKVSSPLQVQPESLKALNHVIQQERLVRQQHRIEYLKALNNDISTRRFVC